MTITGLSQQQRAVCSANITVACAAGNGSTCTSAANSCGQTNTGTVQCDGTCSASTPANPSGYGNACTSAANACGQTNTGTVQCDGTCSASTPSDSSCPLPTSSVTESPNPVLYNTGGGTTGTATIKLTSSAAAYYCNVNIDKNDGNGFVDISGYGGPTSPGYFTSGTWNVTGLSPGVHNIRSLCANSAMSYQPAWTVSSFTVNGPPAAPTGIITASPNPCTVAAGQSGCPVTVSWNTSNTPSASVVQQGGGTLWTGINGSQTDTGVYSPVTLVLKDSGGNVLGSVLISGNCASGSSWDGNKCAAAVNGVCASTHYNCAPGTSGANQFVPPLYTWTCAGSGGGSSASCSECSNGATNPTSGCNKCTSSLVFNPVTNSCAPAPACTISVSKSSIKVGDTDTLTWTCSNASSCTQTSNSYGFSTGGQTSGSDTTVGPFGTAGTYSFGLTCDTFPIPPFPTITVIQPTISLTATNTRVPLGGNTTLSYAATLVQSCTLYKNGTAVLAPVVSGSATSGTYAVNGLVSQTAFLFKCTDILNNTINVPLVVNVSTTGFSEF
ncbi:MAG: hypothetical protein WAN50_00820 [Minisyncoccia bacterium]